MTELELKFQLPPGARESLLEAVGHRRLERVELDARYFDTAEHALAGRLVALRLRRENGRWVQTLKAAKPHSPERLEHEVELPEGADPRAPDLALHAGTEAGELLAGVLAAQGDPPLVETYRAEVVRLRRVLPYGEALVEWSLDEGRIVAGDRVHPIAELELELKGGEPQALYAMARDWQARHGLWLDPISKAHRGTLLVHGEPFARPVKPEAPRVARGMRGDAMLRSIVAACLAQVLPNAAELANGSTDPEHVHQLRVGLRRLRTALRELEDFAPGLRARVEPRLAPVFDALGQSRDRHVMATVLAPALAAAGAPLALPDSPAAAAPLAPVVRASGFQSELLQLLAYAQGEAEHVAEDKPLPVLRRRLDKLLEKLARAAPDFESLAFDEQHRARKRLKRLRYLAAFAAPLFDGHEVRAWSRAASRAQDALGEHVDRALAAARFEAAAAHDARAWFAVGWLRAQLGGSARQGRKGLERLLEARRFW